MTSFNLCLVAVKECCLYVGPVMMCEASIVLALKSLIQKTSQAAVAPSIIVTKPVMDVMHLSQFQLREAVFCGMTAEAHAGGDE